MGAEDEVRAWVEEFVVGLGLCPFAALPLRKGLVRFATCDASDEAAVLAFVGREMQALAEAPPEEVATTIVIVTKAYPEFEAYLDGLERVEALLEGMELEGLLQVASFHPDYRFEGAPATDPANATNRSPHPLFHLIREDDVELARETHPDVEGIPDRNVELLRKLAAEGKLKTARRGKS